MSREEDALFAIADHLGALRATLADALKLAATFVATMAEYDQRPETPKEDDGGPAAAGAIQRAAESEPAKTTE